MSLEKTNQVAGRGVHLPGNDIDADRIIPARFIKSGTLDKLGAYIFYDERKNQDGSDKPHPLNDSRFQGASILLAGSNFGCGDPDRHAPQALHSFGIRAILTESFAQSFFDNATALGIACAVMRKSDIRALAGLITAAPTQIITLSLLEGKASAADMDFRIVVPDDVHAPLIRGKRDAVAELLKSTSEIQKVADTLPYLQS